MDNKDSKNPSPSQNSDPTSSTTLPLRPLHYPPHRLPNLFPNAFQPEIWKLTPETGMLYSYLRQRKFFKLLKKGLGSI